MSQQKKQTPFQTQDFNKLVNSPMTQAGLQMGLNYTQEIIGQNYSTLEYFFSQQIRYYFDVSNEYVIRKLSIVLCPFIQSGQWTKTSEQYSQEHLGFMPPKVEIHAPDLYIPLMGIMTFVLWVCFSNGQGEGQNFIMKIQSELDRVKFQQMFNHVNFGAANYKNGYTTNQMASMIGMENKNTKIIGGLSALHVFFSFLLILMTFN